MWALHRIPMINKMVAKYSAIRDLFPLTDCVEPTPNRLLAFYIPSIA